MADLQLQVGDKCEMAEIVADVRLRGGWEVRGQACEASSGKFAITGGGIV